MSFLRSVKGRYLRNAGLGSALSLVGGATYLLYDTYSKRWSETHTLTSALYQNVLHKFMSALGSRMRSKLQEDTENFQFVQDQLLLGILKGNKDTDFGNTHCFGDIESASDFRARIPVTTYTDYKAYIDRIVEGEQNVLTPEPIKLLGATSGTSGHKNLHPHTDAVSRTFFLSGISLVFNGLFNEGFQHADQLQKTCKLTFMPRWTHTPNGLIKIGPSSSSPDDKNFARLLPLYSTPKCGFTLRNEQAAMYAHALFALRDRNLGIIEANFAPMILTFFNFMQEHREALCRDLRDGTAVGTKQFGASQEDMQNMQRELQPNPSRAQEVQRAFDNPNNLARKLWPNLNLFLTITTGSFTIYAQQLSRLYGGGGSSDNNTVGASEHSQTHSQVPFYSPIYGATEGLLGVNIETSASNGGDVDGDVGYVLPPTAMFYEFRPLARSNASNGDVNRTSTDEHTGKIDSNLECASSLLLAKDLDIGKRYELIVTNLAGLVRYRIGDVVELKGWFNNAPVVKFCYRMGQVLNVRGEKLNESLLTQAVQKGATSMGLDIVDFCASEHVMVDSKTTPKYHIFVEVNEDRVLQQQQHQQQTQQQQQQQQQQLVDAIDRELMQHSEVYRSFRVKGAICEPHVHLLPARSFAGFRNFCFNANPTGSLTQMKVPRVVKKEQLVQFLMACEAGPD